MPGYDVLDFTVCGPESEMMWKVFDWHKGGVQKSFAIIIFIPVVMQLLGSFLLMISPILGRLPF